MHTEPQSGGFLPPAYQSFGDTLPHGHALLGAVAATGDTPILGAEVTAPAPVPEAAPLHLLDVSMFWSSSGSGGVRRYLSHKREALREAGWHHTLVAPGATGEGEADCGGWPIPRSQGYRFVLRRGAAARLIEAKRPQLIEAADPYVLGWAALDAANALDVPAVAFCHSHLPALVERLLPTALRQRSAARWARRRAEQYLASLYGRYDLVLAPSRSMAESLREIGVSRAQHQPLGVDSAVFHPRARDAAWRRELHAQLELPPDAKLLLYAGRFAPEKNLHLLAQAVDRLGPGHVLLAVGAGPTPPRGERVRLLPVEADSHRLARLMASVDAFVHAGDQETFGLSVLEAMACGTPMAVSAAGGVGEMAGGIGFTVASQRSADWADAMTAALAARDSRRVAHGLERARTHDWPVVLAALMRRYLRALGMPVRARMAAGAARPLTTPVAGSVVG